MNCKKCNAPLITVKYSIGCGFVDDNTNRKTLNVAVKMPVTFDTELLDLEERLQRLSKGHHIAKIGNGYRIWANGFNVLETNWLLSPLYIERTIENIICPKCKSDKTNHRETSDKRLLSAACESCGIKWKHKIQ